MKQKYRQQIILVITGFSIIALGILFFFVLFRADGVRKAMSGLVDILMPFIYGFVIAYLLKPMCNTYEKYLRRLCKRTGKETMEKFCTALAIVGSFLTYLILLYLLLAMMIPQLFNSVMTLVHLIPHSLEAVEDWLQNLFADNPIILNYLGTSVEEIDSMLQVWLRQSVLPSLRGVMGHFSQGVLSFASILMNVFVGLVAAVYILGSRRRFAEQGKMVLYGAVRDDVAEWILREIAFADKMFSGFLAGKVLDSAIIGVLCFIGCSILSIPNTMLVSVIVGITNVIPFFGPYIGLIPSALIILMISPMKTLWFVIFVLVLQQIDGNVVGPRILGNSTGLSGFWVLFSILLFGGLLGFPGMLIGVPLFAVIYDIIKKAVANGLQRHGKESMMKEYMRRYHDEE